MLSISNFQPKYACFLLDIFICGFELYLFAWIVLVQGGWKDLRDDILRQNNGPFTALVWPLSGEDPDDAFSRVPYEKGFNLLYYLESLVGTEAFESFAKHYIDKYKFSTVTSGEFRDTFLDYFETTESSSIVDSLDWSSLFLSPGMPLHPQPDFSNSLSVEAEALAKSIISFSKIESSVLTADIQNVDISVSLMCLVCAVFVTIVCVLEMVIQAKDNIVGRVADSQRDG